MITVSTDRQVKITLYVYTPGVCWCSRKKTRRKKHNASPKKVPHRVSEHPSNQDSPGKMAAQPFVDTLGTHLGATQRWSSAKSMNATYIAQQCLWSNVCRLSTSPNIRIITIMTYDIATLARRGIYSNLSPLQTPSKCKMCNCSRHKQACRGREAEGEGKWETGVADKAYICGIVTSRMELTSGSQYY